MCEKIIRDGRKLQKVHKVLVVLFLTGLDACSTGCLGRYLVKFASELSDLRDAIGESSK